MTDLEITRLCAEAIGIDSHSEDRISWKTVGRWMFADWDPLHDDAQAMALVKKFRLRISQPGGNNLGWLVHIRHSNGLVTGNTDLNHAICECVARMQASKLAGKESER